MTQLSDRPVRDFDHHDPVFAQDPYARYAELADTPVFWSTAYGGFWVVTGYDDVRRVATDDKIFLSAMTGPFEGGVGIPAMSPSGSIPIEVDSPDAERYRKVLMAELSPRAVEARSDAIRQMTVEAIDAFIETGRCDLMTELAIPVPSQMIMLWLGLDTARWAEFTGTVHTMLHSGADQAVIGPAVQQIIGWIQDAMTDRLAHPEDEAEDLIGLLAERLSPEEAAQYTFTLIVAGLDTTSAAIGNALARIDAEPEIRARLAADPDEILAFAEESLRHEAPLQLLARTAARDVELGGQRIAAGDRLLVCWASANRDPAAFADPDRFDPDRADNRHFTFGVGLHRCLGSNIARSTMRIVLSEVMRRIPDFRLERHPVERYHDAAFIYSPKHLPARFTPGMPSTTTTQ